MDKNRFQWTGEEFLEILKSSEKNNEKVEYTEKNFELPKKWLEIRLKLGAITKEEYDEKIKEIKEKYGIKD